VLTSGLGLSLGFDLFRGFRDFRGFSRAGVCRLLLLRFLGL
jgi:hypothetical protein